MAGFRSVAFWIGLSGSAVQGGFLTPLPPWNAGGGAGVQGGFLTPLPLWNAGAMVPDVPAVDDRGSTVFSYGQEKLKRQIIEDDDEVAMAVVIAFLEIMD